MLVVDYCYCFVRCWLLIFGHTLYYYYYYYYRIHHYQ